MSNIPVSQTNLGGNKVRDLVEALLKLDQDIKVDVDELSVLRGILRITTANLPWLDEINDQCGTTHHTMDQLCEYIADLQDESRTLADVKEALT